ncbi:hypothetical protein VE01_06696 [Pseudogymnoascus verrucosus]|uniref:Uncharacterized protein n=1 Tax=Pseudogymnoascus verrucosus TaxID=342668 RepID=A0A1B8GJQ8_9PEZI|nr:uncharacterized protein VE01_06696 [Pseudogymnoascus verrucosus]OBT96034.1 hypothetical protein VE01_06696 [Pseudogymnoascus verrucosus]
METEQPGSEELNFFHKDNVRFKTLDSIRESISELYVSIKDNYVGSNNATTSETPLWIIARSSGKNYVEAESDSEKAPSEVEEEEEEMVDEVNNQEMEVLGSYDMQENAGRHSTEYLRNMGGSDMKEYSEKWSEVLWIIERIFGVFAAKSDQLREFLNGMETVRSALIEELVDGTQGGTDLFHEILAERLQKFGIEEIEDVLDKFVASKAYEAEEVEKTRKESEGSKVLDIARDEIREVFEALKNELEELKKESEELRDELDVLKRGEGH